MPYPCLLYPVRLNMTIKLTDSKSWVLHFRNSLLGEIEISKSLRDIVVLRDLMPAELPEISTGQVDNV